MKRLHYIFTLILISLAVSGYVIRETKEDADLSFIVNDGGTQKEAIKITGSTGGVTVGAPGAFLQHTLNGYWLLNSTGTNSSEVNLNTNGAAAGASPKLWRLWSTGASQVGSGAPLGSFAFYNGTDGILSGYVDRTGAWTFGAANTTTTHIFNTGAGGDRAYITSGNGNTRPAIVLDNASSSMAGMWGSGTTSGLYALYTGAFTIQSQPTYASFAGGQLDGTTVANASTDGDWTLGTTTNTNVHEIRSNNTGNDILVVRNYSTSTSADVRAGIQIVKGTSTVTTSQRYLRFLYNGGSNDNGYITATSSTSVGFTASSDRRIKKDIEDLTGALDKLGQLRPVHYKLKSNNEEQEGFIAQEMYEVFPKKVFRSDDGTGDDLPPGTEPWQVTDSGMVPWLVAAIKEQKAAFDALKSEFDAYKAAHP